MDRKGAYHEEVLGPDGVASRREKTRNGQHKGGTALFGVVHGHLSWSTPGAQAWRPITRLPTRPLQSLCGRGAGGDG